MKIVEFKSSSDVKECHILYISKTNSEALKKFSKDKKSVLLVTDKSGLLQGGSIVNFLDVAGSPRSSYELSNTNAGRRDLTIGSILVTNAVAVK